MASFSVTNSGVVIINSSNTKGHLTDSTVRLDNELTCSGIFTQNRRNSCHLQTNKKSKVLSNLL